jgi:hypothetical protein
MADSQHAEDIYALIRQAILVKDIVALNYRGSVREMCPHVLGKTKGSPYALMYQFAGETKAGLKPDGSPDNWRCIRIEEISNVAVRTSEGEWHIASNYSAMQNCVYEIDVQVEIKAA